MVFCNSYSFLKNKLIEFDERSNTFADHFIYLMLLFLLCLRDLRSRRQQLDFVDSDPQVENITACPN